MSLIFVILVLGLIIMLHECGHFVVAKLSGITVEQFTIGFGPALIKKEYKGTLYAIRALPFGGAVMMKDEEGSSDDLMDDEERAKGSYQSATRLQKLAVCVAGSVMNFLTGVVILMFLFAPAKAVVAPVITEFAPGFELQGEGGLQVGDKITSINGFHVFVYSDLQMGMNIGEGKPYDIIVRRGGEKVKLEDVVLKRTLFEGEKAPRFGITFGYEEMSFWDKPVYSVKTAVSFLQSAWKSLGMIFSGEAGVDDMMGVVGIAGEMSDLAKQEDTSSFWTFVAYLAVNLGFMNLLPIPGLDGGKIFLLLAEWIVGRKIPEKYEYIISLVGLGLILLLFVFVTFNDIRRLIG